GDEQIEMLKDRLRSELRKGIGTIFFFDSKVSLPTSINRYQQPTARGDTPHIQAAKTRAVFNEFDTDGNGVTT
mgnify:CR=1